MNEKLLHFIWKYRLFHSNDLFTTAGEKVEVIHPGTHNSDAGADFQNAKIKIGNTLWAGNVEMHVNSNDWFTHEHQNDRSYDNVILHAVYESREKTAVRKSKEPIPTLELKSKINGSTLSRYQELSKRKSWVPCEKFFGAVEKFAVKNFLGRLSVERLEGKTEQIKFMLAENENDWENVMFQMIARYFGASINKDPFLLLAKSLPVKIWAKHQYEPLQIEALVFGQAGFLEERPDDEYPDQLRKEYTYLKRLHHLQPLPKHLWKFLRLRPSNFPTLRLAQLAALMHKEAKLFSKIIDAKNIKTIHQFFEINVSNYWKSHYLFDKEVKKANSHPGDMLKNILLINAVAPVLFAYGKYKADEDYCERAIALLDACGPETNSIVTGWKKLGLVPVNACESQALLQLKGEYCDKFGCLECAIGAKILQ